VCEQCHSGCVDCGLADRCVNGCEQAKAGGKKLPPATLTVSPAGLRIVNMASEAVVSDLDIYRLVDTEVVALLRLLCPIPSSLNQLFAV